MSVPDQIIVYGIIVIMLALVAYIRWADWSVARRQCLKHKAFQLHVQTGYEGEAFSLLSHRARKAAARQHLALVRQRVDQARIFETVCACPNCTRLDMHHMTPHQQSGRRQSVLRVCTTCDYPWIQETP